MPPVQAHHPRRRLHTKSKLLKTPFSKNLDLQDDPKAINE